MFFSFSWVLMIVIRNSEDKFRLWNLFLPLAKFFLRLCKMKSKRVYLQVTHKILILLLHLTPKPTLMFLCPRMVVGHDNFVSQKEKVICSYRGYNGHTMDRCNKIHGYLPRWNFTRTKNLSSGVVNEVSFSGLETGSPIEPSQL